MKKKKKDVGGKVIIPPPMTSPFDPLGSWTGIPYYGEDELPVQDVDDL